jgi:hypothetical protein
MNGSMNNKKSVALVSTAVSSAAAAAAAASVSYSVKRSVPSITQTPSHKFKASGTARSASHLTVFIAEKCAASPKAEASAPGPVSGKPAWRIISRNVSRSYSASKTSRVGAVGVHYVCAYLTPTSGSAVRAHSSSSYTALTPGY